MTTQIQTLSITGYRQAPVPHCFFRQDDDAGHLAIVLPGYGYSCDMPLLYFTVSHFLDHGSDVLQVEYNYSRQSDYRTLDDSARQQWLFTDVIAAYRAGLAQRSYQRVTLIGKSLGTRAMAHLLTVEEGLPRAATVWFTPLWNEEPVRTAILAARRPTLVVIGTADPLYDTAITDAVRGAIGEALVVVADAEHGLEVTGDVIRSVRALEEVMRAVQRLPA